MLYRKPRGKYKYADKVESGEDSITVNGKKITIYKEADASKLPWGELKVDVVLECTGFCGADELAVQLGDNQADCLCCAGGVGNDVACGYDNENSYTSQMVRTIKYFSELG